MSAGRNTLEMKSGAVKAGCLDVVARYYLEQMVQPSPTISRNQAARGQRATQATPTSQDTRKVSQGLKTPSTKTRAR